MNGLLKRGDGPATDRTARQTPRLSSHDQDTATPSSSPDPARTGRGIAAAERVERDAEIARVIVDVLGRVPDAALAGAYDELRDLPAGLHDAVLAEARTRADLERAERGALCAEGCS